MKKQGWVIALCVLLAVSLGGNAYFVISGLERSRNEIWNYNFPDANMRDTYGTVHHVSEAQKISTGKGIKIGILDWGFGYKDHDGLYAGGMDFTEYKGHDENFNHATEHGFWMAQTLREIAPDVEIYALGTYVPDDEAAWVDALIEGIDWAAENDIDVLTLSHEWVTEDNSGRLDEAVDKAIEKGVTTTFIHYCNDSNILPWGLWADGGEGYYTRTADINIFQYDYDTFFADSYKQQLASEEFADTYKDNLFLSVSSMSVVTGGIVAMMLEANPDLTPAQCKEILISTSEPMEYDGEKVEHVVNAYSAVKAAIDLAEVK